MGFLRRPPSPGLAGQLVPQEVRDRPPTDRHVFKCVCVGNFYILEVPAFPGHKSLGEILVALPQLAQDLSRVAARLCAGVTIIVEEDLDHTQIRVPLDIHRVGMQSLQWYPYLLTELSVGNQADLLSILHDLHELQRHTRRPVPLLVDMDIHYRVMKLLYGVSTSGFNMSLKMNLVPVLYGV